MAGLLVFIALFTMSFVLSSLYPAFHKNLVNYIMVNILFFWIITRPIN